MTDEGYGDFPVASPDEFDRHPLTARKCYRHSWFQTVVDANGEIVRVAAPGPLPHREATVCRRCGRPRDEAVRRRNRGNKQRGGAYERTVAKQLGGRRTGPLGGRDDVMVGEMFSVQTKKTINFSVRQARVYLDDLTKTYPTRTALVVHAEPGRDRDAVVVLRMRDWLALHGPDATEDPR